MMRILGIESSAKAASVALLEDGVLVAQNFQNSGLTHSVTLMPMVQAVLEQSGTKPQDLDLIAVAQGPGSFTGVRIGVAAAKGLAWGLDKPVCGVSTLAAMAHQVPWFTGVICPVMDARRQELYNAKFLVEDGQLRRLCPDRAVSMADLAAEIEKSEKMHLFLGDGALLCYNAMSGLKNVCLAPENLRLQTAYGVAAAAKLEDAVSAGELNPVYLRLSQAERERLEREQAAKG